MHTDRRTDKLIDTTTLVVAFRNFENRPKNCLSIKKRRGVKGENTKVETLIVATIYLQLIQNRYMFRSFTVLHCSHQHCLQPVASDVEVVGYL